LEKIDIVGSTHKKGEFSQIGENYTQKPNFPKIWGIIHKKRRKPHKNQKMAT
jgi:hypothetical protein